MSHGCLVGCESWLPAALEGATLRHVALLLLPTATATAYCYCLTGALQVLL